MKDSEEEFTEYTYRVLDSYPHDSEAFTQGLIFHNGYLYEGTGLNGKSTVRKVELETGGIVKIFHLEEKYFGEGVTIFNDQIIQLTWQSKKGFVYDLETFELIKEFSYPTEGWGLTHDGENLIMSDGTDKLYYLDPGSLKKVKEVEVYDEEGAVENLNELEYIDGKIYANIWLTDFIVIIDPETGEVFGRINFEGLLTQDQEADVLNGIAYDSEKDRLFVTGKLWPNVFEVEIVQL
ncbi:glutaminyl-peptide cyclotransferase [Candidatus Dojkabacteria bacterium]|nr:glutaminyl-peptide cyclotransferase [Candidatus Dojkabacteria bacterium]